VMASSGGSVFDLPWCPPCGRMHLGTTCVECGLPLEIGQFVPLERAQRSEQLAWDLAADLRATGEHSPALTRFDEAVEKAVRG
jgi:hypothetical protein